MISPDVQIITESSLSHKVHNLNIVPSPHLFVFTFPTFKRTTSCFNSAEEKDIKATRCTYFS